MLKRVKDHLLLLVGALVLGSTSLGVIGVMLYVVDQGLRGAGLASAFVLSVVLSLMFPSVRRKLQQVGRFGLRVFNAKSLAVLGLVLAVIGLAFGFLYGSLIR
ncbi:MAG: hypothetical protein K8F91_09965 [Candidatus Obscuribacterales bacterium]|nr:hypothetical protein [Candidatus Obscuribacterales bacterium]